MLKFTIFFYNIQFLFMLSSEIFPRKDFLSTQNLPYIYHDFISISYMRFLFLSLFLIFMFSDLIINALLKFLCDNL